MSDSTSQTAKATYEGDVLRLDHPLPLANQQRVLVHVVPVPEPVPDRDLRPPDEILRLAAQVYKGLSPEDVQEIERIAHDRSRFFTERE